MSLLLRITLLALVGAGSSFRLAGCADLVHATTLYPDGSGRFVVTWGSSKSEDGKDEPAENMLSRWELLAEGVAAWGEPTMKVVGKSVFYTMTAYFEDINKLRWFNEAKEGRELLLSFEYRKADRGGSLTITDRMVKHAKEEAAKPLEKEEDKKEDPGEGDRYWATFTVPGTIKESKGFHEVKERSATLRYAEKTVSDARKGDKNALRLIGQLASPMTIAWVSSDVTEAESAAFRKEFAAVRESWKARKPRLEKIREEEKKKRD